MSETTASETRILSCVQIWSTRPQERYCIWQHLTNYKYYQNKGALKKIKTWFLFWRIFGNWVHKNLPRLSPDRVKYRHIYDHRGGQIRPNIQCPNPDLSRNINWSKFVWRWRHHDFEPENSRWSKYYWPLATRLPLNLRMMIMTFAIF